MIAAVAGDPLRTPLCELLGIDLPILLGPMAGGPGTPALAGAVSAAGGLGFVGVTMLAPDATAEAVREAVLLSGGRPIGVNVQLARPKPGAGTREALRGHMAPLRRELELPEEGPEPPAEGTAPVAAAELVRIGLEAGATVVSTALGDPGELAELTRSARVPIVAAVSSVDEARRAEAAGAAAIVAQGWEAGGHRTTFEVGETPLPAVGTLALVPQVVDAVGVPVIAAGGIADGRGLAAALALGAQGAMIGTRFLLAEEAGTTPAHREAVAALADTDTFVTDAVTGRAARWARNRLAGSMAEGPPPLGWGPAQRAEIADVARAAAVAGRTDLMPVLAGQAAGLDPRVLPAAEIVEAIASRARAVLRALSPE